MDFPLGDLQSICREFGIGDLIAVEGRLGGFVNTNLKIKTEKGLFVIRIYREKFDPQRIHYAHDIISILRSSNVPALMPIQNKFENYFSTYNDHFIEVTPFVQANHFRWIPNQAYFSGIMLRLYTIITIGVYWTTCLNYSHFTTGRIRTYWKSIK
jgi:hypothetical protein